MNESGGRKFEERIILVQGGGESRNEGAAKFRKKYFSLV